VATPRLGVSDEFDTDCWIHARIAIVIERLTDVGLSSRAHAWKLQRRRLG
jgi:hypothetical protein